MPYVMAGDTAAVLGKSPKISNRSLFADKFAEFPADDKDKEARSRMIERLAGSGFDPGTAGASRVAALAALPAAVVFRLRLGARMIVNHAGGVIENAGLALDRHTGAPFIPGSTLKGLARLGARMTAANPEEVALVFGWAANRNQEPDIPVNLPVRAFAGSVAFLPAYAVGAAPLERDIVTVHHHAYYAGKQRKGVDNEQPIPNQFPVVKAGSEFQFVLGAVSQTRVKSMAGALGLPGTFNPVAKAKEWLIIALSEMGAGAKTAAGYGWFEYDAAAEQQRVEDVRLKRVAEEAARQAAEAENLRLSSLSPVDRQEVEILKLDSERFSHFAKALGTRTPDEQRAFVRVIKTHAAKKDWWKTKKKKDAPLADAIRQVAKAVGEELA
jgi:CRISPR-associated protein Cmr6